MVGSINGDTPRIIRPTGEVRTEPCLALQQPKRSLLALSGGRRALHATHPTPATQVAAAHTSKPVQPSPQWPGCSRRAHSTNPPTQANTSQCSQCGGEGGGYPTNAGLQMYKTIKKGF